MSEIVKELERRGYRKIECPKCLRIKYIKNGKEIILCSVCGYRKDTHVTSIV